MALRCLLALMLAALTACAPPPTPFPVDIPPPPVDAPPSADTVQTTALRYALGPRAVTRVADLQQILPQAQLEQLSAAPDPADLGVRFDIAADYGIFPGAQASPVSAHLSLIVDPSRPPLSDSMIADIVRTAVELGVRVSDIPGAEITAQQRDTEINSLRVALANAGWPDGFELNAAVSPVPGVPGILTMLHALGIETRTLSAAKEDVWQQERLHLAIVAWYTPDQRARWVALASPENVIDLYSIPIGYIAAPGIDLTFTADGWPVPVHP